jgi:hypothetical protein
VVEYWIVTGKYTGPFGIVVLPPLPGVTVSEPIVIDANVLPLGVGYVYTPTPLVDITAVELSVYLIVTSKG